MSRASTRYIDPEALEATITPSKLKRMGKDRQIAVMRFWFFENYQDPANDLPLDREDPYGFAWVNGGPFEARDVLRDEFSGIADDTVICELASNLDYQSAVWTPVYVPTIDDFYEIDAALELDENQPLDAVGIRLGKLKQLLDQKDRISDNLHDFQRMMIFSFCITTMESFLADNFIRRVMGSQELKQKFIRSDGKFSQQNFPLTQIFAKFSAIDATIKGRLMETSFHNLNTARRLYKEVLDMDLGDVDALEDSVKKRHDFIHRGGKDKEGNAVSTTVDEIRALIDQIEQFCRLIEARFAFAPVVVIPPPARN